MVWSGRLAGNYSASPVWVDGRIYAFNEDGKTTVLEAGREFKVLAENQLDDGFMASPAVAGEALFLRTRTHLYRIEDSALTGHADSAGRYSIVELQHSTPGRRTQGCQKLSNSSPP